MKERTGSTESAPLLPERLAVLVSDIGTRFNRLGPGMDDVWQAAIDSNEVCFDWKLDLPQAAAAACEFYGAVLDEADEFGLSAQLLTLPASATSVAVRRWFVSEIIGQLHGKTPVAWADSRFRADLPALARVEAPSARLGRGLSEDLAVELDPFGGKPGRRTGSDGDPLGDDAPDRHFQLGPPGDGGLQVVRS